MRPDDAAFSALVPVRELGENMKIKIMAVDDEPAVLHPLKTMLESHGYEVLAVGDSREALKRLEVEKVDGLFVDVKHALPGWL